jgi:sugar O-acyltransferase (sialic acid O-acetyltransferase NeuD family)
MVVSERKPDHIFFFDDACYAAHEENTFPFEAFQDERFSGAEFYVALGYRHLRRKADIINQLLARQRELPSIVHPTCHVGADTRIGAGCIFYPMCNVDIEVTFGNGVLLNNSSIISHQCEIGNAVYFSPGVVLCGRAQIGSESFLGAGALVSDNVSIGSGVRVAIGTVVTKDIPDNASVIGSPIRLLTQPLRL